MRCEHCGRPSPADGVYCASCGRGFSSAPACPGCGAHHSQEAAFCGQCGRRLADGVEARGERKVVTVMFADVSGFTALSEQLDPEEVTVVMNRLFDALGAPILAHGGHIDKFIGDCVMALFGAPVAHENDPERACRSALEMQVALTELVRELPFEVAVNIGINSGMVVAGEVGTIGRRDYTVMGDAVNTAQRIQSAAKGGITLVSESVRRQVGGAFHLTPLEPILAKGKEKPVPVFRLDGSASAIHRREASIVGREAELATLKTALERTMRGQGAVVALSGEAGIGKSRLLSAIIDDAERCGMSVAVGHSVAHLSDAPFAPLLDMIRDAFEIAVDHTLDQVRQRLEERCGELGVLAPDQVALGGWLGTHEVDPTIDSGAERFVPFLEVSRALARRGPALLIVEDLHWADGQTLEFLSLLADETPTLALLVVLSSRRPVTLPEGVAVEPISVELGPLSIFEARRLLSQAIDGRTLPASLEEAILSRAEGHPFFVEELARSVDDVDVGALPETVQAVVAARIDRLDKSSKWSLQGASVLGRTFPVSLLQVVLEDDELLPRLNTLASVDLIEGPISHTPPTWAFKQAITREVAYASLLRQTARPLHLAVARGMLELYGDRLDERAAELARHFEEGGDLIGAIEYGLVAAEADRRAQALDAAERRYGGVQASIAALDAPGDRSTLQKVLGDDGFRPPPEGEIRRWRLTTHLGLADIQRIRGRWDEAEGSLRRAASLAAQLQEREAEVGWAQGRLEFQKGDFDAGRDWAEKALAGAAQDDRAAQAACRHLLGNISERQGRADEAEQQLVVAIGLFADLDDQRSRAAALADLGTARLNRGRVEEALETQRRSLEIKERIGDRLGICASLVNMGNIHETRGEHRRALGHFDQALETYRVIGDRRGIATTLLNIATVRCRLGQLGPAEESAREALDRFTLLGDRLTEGIARLNLGAITRAAGRLVEALDENAQARAIFARASYAFGVGAGAGNLGEILHEQGQYAESIESLDEALEVFTKLGVHELINEISLYRLASLVAMGDADEAALEARVQSSEGDLEVTSRALLAAACRRRGDDSKAAAHAADARAIAADGADASLMSLVDRLAGPIST